MPSIFETHPKRTAQATLVHNTQLSATRVRAGLKPSRIKARSELKTTKAEARSKNNKSRAKTNSERARGFQALLLDSNFSRLLDQVSKSLEKLTNALEEFNHSKEINLPQAQKNLDDSYNSISLALTAAQSRFRKFARNKATATDLEKRLFYIKAIQILPKLKKITCLQAPDFKSDELTSDKLDLKSIKKLAQSTYLELHKTMGDEKTKPLTLMNDSDISAEMSRYQLSPMEQKMNMQQLLTRVTRNKDADVPQIAVTKKGVEAQKVKPTLEGLLKSRVLLNPLKTLINLQKLIKESLTKETENDKEQIGEDVLLQIARIDKKEILAMTLSENEKTYNALVEIASTLNANGLNNKEVHDALNNLITITSQAINLKENQRHTSQALSGDAVMQEIEKHNVFQKLNTGLDKMIEMAKTWTLSNINLVESLREISKGKNEFSFSVLKQTKFSNKELEILQGKIRHVISSVPEASHNNSFITSLIEMDKIISNQLIKSTSEAIRKGNNLSQTRQREDSRSNDNLPKVRNPLGEWREAINQLQKVVSRKIDLVKEKLAPLLNKIVQFSRYKKVQEKVPFQSIEDQIFQAYKVFEQRNFNKIPAQDYQRIEDLFLSTAVKLEEMHNPKLAA